jgi:hypothetical protein
MYKESRDECGLNKGKNMKHVVTILGISMVGLLTACHPSGGGTGQKASANL